MRRVRLYLAVLTTLLTASGPAQQPLSIELVRPPALPRAIASFGAATADSWLYVFGGHVGRAHDHSRDNVVGTFRRLNLLDGTSWEELPPGPALQGTALVAHAGRLYRIGGMTAHNAPHEMEDMHSTASVDCFDPRSGGWQALPPLPEPRSSHDACVLDGKLYVIGGWQLAGGSDGDWHASAWMADLAAPELAWQRLPDPPFRRRALAVAPAHGRIMVLGGMDAADEEPTARTAQFDPATATWSEGPQLPEPGFGIAAHQHGTDLICTTRRGAVLRLDAASARWQRMHDLAFPRMFHRLASAPGGRLLVLGGAGGGSHLRSMEFVETRAPHERLLVQEWTIPLPTRARNRQGVLLQDGGLILFGGNRELDQHAFEPEDFVADACRVDLAQLHAVALPDFPAARQSVEVVQWGRRGRENLLLGGFGHDGEVARAQDAAFTLTSSPARFTPAAHALPQPRTQFRCLAVGEQLWLLGGTDFDPRRGDDAAFRFPLEVLVRPVAEAAAPFTASGLTLPTPRRAFGVALLDGEIWLIGGMREQFTPVAHCDVLDPRARSWRQAPAPTLPRISPEVATLDGRIYLAGGSSRRGERFEPDPRLELFDPRQGWSTLVEELPFPTRHLRMFAWGEQLLFLSTHHRQPGQAKIWLLRPPATPAERTGD